MHDRDRDRHEDLNRLREVNRSSEPYSYATRLIQNLDSLLPLFSNDQKAFTEIATAYDLAVSLRDSLEPVREQILKKIAEIEPIVIKSTELESPMTTSISETIKGEPKLLHVFPDPEKGRQAVEEFLTSIIQITKFKNVSLGDCEIFTHEAVSETYSPFFAAEISQNASYINHILGVEKISFSEILEEAVLTMSENLKAHYPSEFEDDEDDLVENEIISSEDLGGEIWKYGLEEGDRKLLIDFWSEVHEKDRDAILADPSGFESALALARFSGAPLNPGIESLGKTLSSALSVLQKVL